MIDPKVDSRVGLACDHQKRRRLPAPLVAARPFPRLEGMQKPAGERGARRTLVGVDHSRQHGWPGEHVSRDRESLGGPVPRPGDRVVSRPCRRRAVAVDHVKLAMLPAPVAGGQPIDDVFRRVTVIEERQPVHAIERVGRGLGRQRAEA